MPIAAHKATFRMQQPGLMQDYEVRLWDLRTVDCQGVLRCPGNPTAAYDPQVRPRVEM